MAPFKVVVVDVVSDRSLGFLGIVPLSQIGFLIFEGTEPPLDLDVVSPTVLSIHALEYIVLLEKFLVFLAGELAALI